MAFIVKGTNIVGATTGGISEETDPTVPSWAKAPTKPEYNAEEVGAVDEDDIITTTEINALFD